MIDQQDFSKIEKIENTNLLNSFDNLDCIVFILTESHTITYFYEMAKKTNKFIILIKFGQFSSYHDDNIIIHFNDPIESESNQEAMKQFKVLLNQSLMMKLDVHEDLTLSCECISSTKIMQNISYLETRMISNNELLASTLRKSFILDTENDKIDFIDHQSFLLSHCWIDHLEAFVVQMQRFLKFYFRNSSQNKEDIEIKIDLTEGISKEISHIFYMKNERKTFAYIRNTFFIYDHNFSLESTRLFTEIELIRMQAIEDKIFLASSKSINVYDSKLSFLKKIEFKSEITSEIRVDNFNSNYCFVNTYDDIQIISSNSMKIIGYIEINKNLLMVSKGNMLFEDNFRSFEVHRFKYKKYETNPSYFCKLNLLSNPHLVSNPYYLPCRCTACFKCICIKIHEDALNCFVCNRTYSKIVPGSLERNLEVEKLIQSEDLMKHILRNGEDVIENIGLLDKFS